MEREEESISSLLLIVGLHLRRNSCKISSKGKCMLAEEYNDERNLDHLMSYHSSVFFYQIFESILSFH